MTQQADVNLNMAIGNLYTQVLNLLSMESRLQLTVKIRELKPLGKELTDLLDEMIKLQTKRIKDAAKIASLYAQLQGR